MDIFNIIVGITTILSFIVSLIALKKVDKIEKHIIDNNEVEQNITNNEINNSSINISGRDSRK